MSSGKTEHFSLHQWAAGDNFLRGEFNENFARIDSAVAAKASVVVGSYEASSASPLAVELGFQPVAVLLEATDGSRASLPPYGGLLLPGAPLMYGKEAQAEITPTGFRVSGRNLTGSKHYYLAFQAEG